MHVKVPRGTKAKEITVRNELEAGVRLHFIFGVELCRRYCRNGLPAAVSSMRLLSRPPAARTDDASPPPTSASAAR